MFSACAPAREALDQSPRARDHARAVNARSKPDDPVKLAPAERIEARVQDAVGEIAGVPEPRSEPPREPEALELAAVAPFVRPKASEPRATAFGVKRGLRRLAKFLAIAAVLAVLVVGALVLMSGRAGTLLEDDEALWTFTDKDGVVHIVDDLDSVPAEHRKQAVPSR